MTGTEIYWLTRLDGIVNLSTVMAIFGTVSAIVGTIVLVVWAVCENGKADNGWWFLLKTIIIVWIASILFVLATLFVPTTKEMAAIIVVPKIVNNEQVKELPENVLDLANEWIKSKKEELKD
jgi:hypothetical protein